MMKLEGIEHEALFQEDYKKNQHLIQFNSIHHEHSRVIVSHFTESLAQLRNKVLFKEGFPCPPLCHLLHEWRE